MDTNKTIKIKISSVWGRELIYPVNDQAVRFTKLTGTKTLSRQAVSIIKNLGFEVKVLAPTL